VGELGQIGQQTDARDLNRAHEESQVVELAGTVRYGRVTEAAINWLRADCCFTGTEPPHLGEFVAVEDTPQPIIAVVSAVVTEGIDPSRRVVAHGTADQELARVLQEHPHVPALLLTTFEATVVGHRAGGVLCQYLPPAPSPILARVRGCSNDEIEEFTAGFDFLRLLLEAGPLADEVLAAALRRAGAARRNGRPFLVRAGKALAPLLARDPTRLQATLRRMQP
jgi:hypothetical protein